MPDQLWNILGALTIAAALVASHPLNRAQTEHLRERISASWQEMAPLSCDDASPGQSRCFPTYWEP